MTHDIITAIISTLSNKQKDKRLDDITLEQLHPRVSWLHTCAPSLSTERIKPALEIKSLLSLIKAEDDSRDNTFPLVTSQRNPVH